MMEGRVRIPEGATFCLTCCHKNGDSKEMGEGEGMKLHAEGFT